MRVKGLCNLTLSVLIAALLTAVTPAARAEPPSQYDYPKMWNYARQMLTRAPVRKFLKDVFAEELKISPEMQKQFNYPEAIKEMSESQFVLLLQNNPKLWPMIDEYLKAVPEIKEDDPRQEEVRKAFREKFRAAIEDKGVRRKFQKINDAAKPMLLIDPNGPGYRNVKFYVNHIRIMEDGTVIPPDDLQQVWIEFFHGGEKQEVVNVFEFDLERVADELIAKADSGLDVRVGIHKPSAETNPKIQAIVEKLKKHKNIMVHLVDPVGLNHQKLAARDWELSGKGAALSSSGNLTQSCSGKEGDLADVPEKERPKFSVPNANHMITTDSDILANLVNHELTKTLNPEYRLRGKEYPLSGAWQILGGSGKDPKVDPWMIVMFSPNGGIGDINLDGISRLIRLFCGKEIFTMQFAFSSKTIEDALKWCAKKLAKEGKKLPFEGVFQRSFAGMDWSVPMSMIGYKQDEKSGSYLDDPDSDWKKILGKDGLEKMRKNVFAEPEFYGEHSYTYPDGHGAKVNAKTHHKMMAVGDYVIAATSFNFSEGALSNQEQLIIWKDPEVLKHAKAMYRGYKSMTTRTLEEVLLRKNEFLEIKKSGLIGIKEKGKDKGIKGGGSCPGLLKKP